MRSRTTLGMGVMVALAIAVWAAVTAGGDDEPVPTSTPTTAPSTTTEASTTTTPPTTTTVPTSTSAALTPSTTDPEARIEEVRLILEDLYFRWFDAIYRNDEEAVREIIATRVYLDAFHNAVETMDLPRAPKRSEIHIEDVEVLHQSSKCLVAFSVLDVTEWRGDGAITQGVDVLLRDDGKWKLGTAWTHEGDLWQDDCKIEPEI